MEKSFICPKCKSENVRVNLKDGTVLKSLGNKLTVDSSNKPLNNNFDLKSPLTICLECKLEFSPKCLQESDII